MKFDLTPEEVQTVVNALAQRPFAEVHALVPKIVKQAQEQQTASEVIE